MRVYLKKDISWLFFLAVLALLVRAALLFASDFVIDSDEAIVGLMAKHILEGRELPIFYYGQDYMGSFEALLTVPFFVIFGQTSFALKLVPLIFSLIHVLLVYELAFRFAGRFQARLASIFCALPPSALVLWGTKARGGFIELVAIGTLALILSVDLLGEKRPRKTQFFWLAALLGLGWWVNNQIIFYILAIVVVFFIHFLKHFGFRESLKFFLISSLAFFLGSLPFWVYNLQKPFFRTISFLLSNQAPAGSNFADNLQGFFTKALPIIFGARRFWNEQDIFHPASVLVYSVYALCFSIFLLSCWKSKERSSYALVLVFIFCVAFIFSASSFGWLSLAPRYLLPLYSVIFVVLGVAIVEIRKISVLISNVLIFFVLALNFASNYYPRLEIPGEPFVYRGERVSRDQTELYDWLKANNYRHINTNYWLGYRVAFETKEEITFTRLGSPRSLRIPEYELWSLDKEEAPVYVGVPSEMRLLAKSFASLGYSFRQSHASSYLILDQLKPVWGDLEQLELKPEQLIASEREDLLGALIDRDLSTRWGSSKPQYPGMSIELKFDQPEEIAAVAIEMGKFLHDGPRELTIEGQDMRGNWCVLFDSYGTKMFYDALEGNYGALPVVLSVYFKPEELQSLRLVQRGKDKIFDWSIAELKIYRKKQ